MFSLISCAEVLVALFTGIAITSMYKATVEMNPAFTFYFVGVSTIIPIMLSMYVLFFIFFIFIFIIIVIMLII